MSSITQQQVASAIAQAMQYVPTVWPLQQFIATNPLWDLRDQKIEDLSEALMQLDQVPTTASLSYYWELFQTGDISREGLHQSTAESVTDNPEADSLFHQLLAGFTQSTMHQLQLQDLISQHGRDERYQYLLFSYQVREKGYDDAYEAVQRQCLGWLSAYFNPTKAQQSLVAEMRGTDGDSFYALWHRVQSHQSGDWQDFLADFPVAQDMTVLIVQLLSTLSVPSELTTDYILAIAWQLKGWLGYIKWQEAYPDNPYVNRVVSPAEVIALWLAYEVFWLRTHHRHLADFQPSYARAVAHRQDCLTQECWLAYIAEVTQEMSAGSRAHIEAIAADRAFSFQALLWFWQRAAEISYEAPLHRSLLAQKVAIEAMGRSSLPIKAQWVFCIDVRSEGMRRHLERIGSHETFGFAGFFGVAYQLCDHVLNKQTCQCPALLTPDLLVEMLAAPQSLYRRALSQLAGIMQVNRKSLLSPFALYELMGLWFGVSLVLKNYASDFVQRVKSRLFSLGTDRDVVSAFSLDHIDLVTKVSVARQLLQGIGLVQDFAPFVVICGHGASTENNPYQAALDCGACGGNSGVSNAVIACQILNDSEVRRGLLADGIEVPTGTVFIGACHDTTTDRVVWRADRGWLTDGQRRGLAEIQADADVAGERLCRERLAGLPGNQCVLSRASHWAELIPEWGLAGNAAFVVGSRLLTRELDLGRRVFLHSYDAAADPSGEILAGILMGPVVVAHWINIQYYFSTLSGCHFGAGNKAIHNVLPGVGVMVGNQSDLRYGLPSQSVCYWGRWVHRPQRLCVFIDALPGVIEGVIARNACLRSLVGGRWLFIRHLGS